MLAGTMVPDEPVRGSYAYLLHPGLLSMPGLDQFRPFIRRQVPSAPINRLSGLYPVEAALGSVTFSMPASPWWQSGVGVFLGGSMAFAADAALGGAIFSTLPPGKVLATSELSMNFLRPASVASGAINARGRVIQVGRSQGLSEAQIEDAQGRLLAHATSRCILMPLPFDPPPPPESFPPVEPDVHDTPDPYLRPTEGEVLSHEAWQEKGGLEIQRRWMKGDIPNAPVTCLFGWRGLEIEEGAVAYAMPASEWFCTSPRTFYGGALAVYADMAMNSAITTTIDGQTAYGTLDLKVQFVRAVKPDGRDLVARARVVHRGRTLAVTTCEIEDADGKRVALATSSAILLPGHRWTSGAVAPIDEGGARPDG